MTNATDSPAAVSMQANLETWCKNMKDMHDASFALNTAEEVSLDEQKFVDNKITAEMWQTLVTQCPEAQAFSATRSDLTAVEAPAAGLEAKMEVLDFSENPIKSIDFVKAFPDVVSLSLASVELKKVEQLAVLKELQKLQILELSSTCEDADAQLKDPEALHKHIFEMIPDLIAFNGLGKDGDELDIGGPEDFEEEDMFNMEEEDDDDLEGLLEEEDFEEEDMDELEEGEVASPTITEEMAAGDDEPAAKRQKTEA